MRSGSSSPVSSPSDAGKKISGRKTFGLVDAMGLLVAVIVVACRAHHISAEVVNRIQQPQARSRLRARPHVTEGVVWAAHGRLLLRRLTQPVIAYSRWGKFRDSLSVFQRWISCQAKLQSGLTCSQVSGMMGAQKFGSNLVHVTTGCAEPSL
jgi:hypothetical protein